MIPRGSGEQCYCWPGGGAAGGAVGGARSSMSSETIPGVNGGDEEHCSWRGGGGASSSGKKLGSEASLHGTFLCVALTTEAALLLADTLVCIDVSDRVQKAGFFINPPLYGTITKIFSTSALAKGKVYVACSGSIDTYRPLADALAHLKHSDVSFIDNMIQGWLSQLAGSSSADVHVCLASQQLIARYMLIRGNFLRDTSNKPGTAFFAGAPISGQTRLVPSEIVLLDDDPELAFKLCFEACETSSDLLSVCGRPHDGVVVTRPGARDDLLPRVQKLVAENGFSVRVHESGEQMELKEVMVPVSKVEFLRRHDKAMLKFYDSSFERAMEKLAKGWMTGQDQDTPNLRFTTSSAQDENLAFVRTFRV